MERRAAVRSETDLAGSAKAMRDAIVHLKAALCLAWEDKQRQDVQSSLDEAQQAAYRLEAATRQPNA